MGYPMLESFIGDKLCFDGKILSKEDTSFLLEETEEITYYETIRIKDNCLLFFEDHLNRLDKSVSKVENFNVDLNHIYKMSYSYLNNFDISNGNLRIVLTKSHLLIHLCEANIPDSKLFINGINTSTLQWERVDPQVKVFRGDYKREVASAFSKENKNGFPYEILLKDNQGKLYEGSKSNLFIIIKDTIYSAPDEKILLGITRNRVLSSMEEVGGKLVIDTFSLDEIKGREDVAIFISSTPFDILPVAYIEDVIFNSASNKMLQKISDSYNRKIINYISDYNSRL